MNPGVVEEGGKVASSVVQALKASPLVLALVLLQIFTLLGIAWSIHERAGYMNEERKMFYDVLAKVCPGKISDTVMPPLLIDRLEPR